MVDERLIDLLRRLQADSSFRKAAHKAGIGSGESLARVWRREGRLSAESIRKLADAFGATYGFTEDDLRRWNGLERLRSDVGTASTLVDPLIRSRRAIEATGYNLAPTEIVALDEQVSALIPVLIRQLRQRP